LNLINKNANRMNIDDNFIIDDDVQNDEKVLANQVKEDSKFGTSSMYAGINS
jgi:hypothetical protein